VASRRSRTRSNGHGRRSDRRQDGFAFGPRVAACEDEGAGVLVPAAGRVEGGGGGQELVAVAGRERLGSVDDR
jgi:hypothetical protein